MNVVRALRARRLRAALPALVAVLALALLPTLSRALSLQSPLLPPAVAADLCRGDTGGNGLHHALEACAHCALAAHAALPPPQAAAAPRPVARPAPIASAVRAGRPRGPAYGAAEARAPPAGLALAD